MNWIDFWFCCVDLVLFKDALLTKQKELNQQAEGISAGLYSDSELVSVLL